MLLSLIPDSAPFNLEQRAWLNGFLAGWLGLPQAGNLSAESSPDPTEQRVQAEDFPWHDPALSITERLKLAEGETAPHRLMAAMAQLDCGACGYVCRTYSEAIARGEETNLSLCSPGGSETSKAIKRLLRQQTASAAVASPTGKAEVVEALAESREWSRKNPYPASIVRSVNLNGPRSEKQTRHVEIDLGGSGLNYKVGDSLGVFPTNCDELVDDVITALGACGDEPVESGSIAGRTARDALARHACLAEVTEDLILLLTRTAALADERNELRRLLEDDAAIAGFDVLDLLRRFPSARPVMAEFVPALAAIRPRLYSISSSPKRHAGQVHLTVGRVSYVANGRVRKGVASTMLADRVRPGSEVRVFVQPSHHFTIPTDPDAPAIMIGPGTGIAPFRAFLHEREALGARGRNWLFFGDQRGECDFLYRDELKALAGNGVLTRLDTAFSRDQDEKHYVQHRLIERGREVFDWLESGAYVFVCGDAKRMAADVDRALRQVVQVHGGMSRDEAGSYVQRLSSSGRYLRDVY